MAAVKVGGIANLSAATCNGDTTRPSCYLTSTELGELDAVAAIRMVISCLSLIGASSIITSTILKRELFNHKIHPIFVLSVADALLALFYIVGGIIWLRRESDAMPRVWCLSVALPTVILQCVTVNLTVLYAILAYSGVRQTHIGNLLKVSKRKSVWSPLRTTISYTIAWLVPVVVVMLPFTAVVEDTGLLGRVDKCSCWCFPSLGNVVPYAQGRDKETMDFRRDMRKLTISLASVIATHFLAGFIILFLVYWFMIKSIHKMRVTVRRQVPTSNYGAVGPMQTEAVLERVELMAKRRVVYFLMAFILSGLFNFLLCCGLMLIDVVQLTRGERMSPAVVDANHQNWWQKLYHITLCLQSLTITQQGFLNAIVYGWTRESFLHIMAVNSQRRNTYNDSERPQQETGFSSSEEEEEVVENQTQTTRQHSPSKEEHSFTRSMLDTSEFEELEND